MLLLVSALLEVEVLLASLLPLLTEELVEHVFMAVVPVGVLPLLLSFESLFSVLVVDGALLWVGEGLVGISYLLEVGLRLVRVVLVLVRVELDGHLLKLLLDLVLCRSPF